MEEYRSQNIPTRRKLISQRSTPSPPTAKKYRKVDPLDNALLYVGPPTIRQIAERGYSGSTGIIDAAPCELY